MNNIRNIIVTANNSGTLTNDEFKAYRSELQQEIGTVVDAMNTNYDGRYIFGGSKTTEPPFEVTKDANGEVNGLKYNGDETNLAREISNGVSINLLTNGNSVMNAQGAGKDLGTFFNELVADLDKHDESSNCRLVEEARRSRRVQEQHRQLQYSHRGNRKPNRCGQRSQ